METRDNILNELKQIAPKLAAIERKNFYEVPNGYFADFKAVMLQQVNLSEVKQELKEIAPALLKTQSNTTAKVPQGYFSSFSAELMQKIRANEAVEELQAIAPALSAIQKQNTLQVPATYFAAFPKQMLRQIAAAETAKQASAMPGWPQSVNVVLENITAAVFKPKYSVAYAGITTMLVVGFLLTVNVEQPQQPCADFLCMADQVKLSDAELNAYLDNTTTDSYQEEVFEQAVNDNTGDVQVNETMLKSLSDDELNNALLD